ncbi:leucine-rich repeat domain-containing protein, partial [Chryseobacterium sp. HMWF001]
MAFIADAVFYIKSIPYEVKPFIMLKPFFLKKSFFLSYLLLSVTALAQNFTYNGLNYTITDNVNNKVKVKNNTNSLTTSGIVIPSTVMYNVQNYTVSAIDEDAFFENRYTPSIIIPNTVTSIGRNAFGECQSMTTMNIPSSVVSIGTNAFSGCSSLISLTVNWQVPLAVTSNQYIFLGVTTSNCTLYVPSGTVSSYTTAQVWSSFNPILPQSPLGVSDFDAENNDMTIYPNPAKEFIILKSRAFKTDLFDYSIIDNLGRRIKYGKARFGEQITIENLQIGKYIVITEIENNKKVATKFI